MSHTEGGHHGPAVEVTQRNALVEGFARMIAFLPSITHAVLKFASQPTMDYMVNAQNNWKGAPAH